MATPAFRAAGTAVFSANNVANPSILAVTAPAGRVVNDLLLLITESRSITATVATPAGWQILTGFPVRSATASGGSIYVFGRIANGTASDDASPSWSGVTTGTNGDSCGARIIAWSNASLTQAGTVTSADAASTTSITMPAITTTAINSLVVGIAVKINDTAHTFTVATRTERSDDHTTTGTGHGTVVADQVIAAIGSSGTATVTPSTTVSSRTLAVSLSMKNIAIVAAAQATETETAGAMGVRKTLAIGQVTDTETATVAGKGKVAPIGRASDTETGAVVTPVQTSSGQTIPVGQASEAATARAVSPTKAKAIGQAATSELATPVARSKTGTLGAVLSAETSLVVAARKLKGLLGAVDAGSAGALAALKSAVLAQATDASSALAVAVAKVKLTTLAVEDNSASAVEGLHERAVGATVDTEVAQGLAATKLGALTVAGSSDTALGLTSAHSGLAGVAEEVDASASVAASKLLAIAQAEEADTADSVSIRGRISQAFESVTARLISGLKARGVAQAVDTETATPVAPLMPLVVGVAQPEEVDAAFVMIARRALGHIVEQDSATVVVALDPQLIALGRATESATASPVFVLVETTPSRTTVTGLVTRDLDTLDEGVVVRVQPVTGAAAGRGATIRTGSIQR